MNTAQAYDLWSASYDTVVNPTRDLEAAAIRAALGGRVFNSVLELGCGTGKNTVWLADNAARVTASDFSVEMMRQARERVLSENVAFLQLDVRADWPFHDSAFDLVACSLILEHVEDLRPVFQKAARSLETGGLFYVGELHPFKQYSGSKARFETEDGLRVLECFNHHLSDFVCSAVDAGFEVFEIREWFDDGNSQGIPRILSMLFKKAPPFPNLCEL